MSYAALMVYVEDEPSRVRLAADLAKRFRASLIGIAARASMPVVTGEDAAVDAVLFDQEQAGIKVFLQKAEEGFRAATAGSGISVEWRAGSDFPNDFVAQEARAADLLVVGQTPAAAYGSLENGGVLLHAGRPVLVVPKSVA
jgi:hypothetical protein